MDKLVERSGTKLDDKIFDRAFMAWSLQHEHLEDTMHAKPGAQAATKHGTLSKSIRTVNFKRAMEEGLKTWRAVKHATEASVDQVDLPIPVNGGTGDVPLSLLLPLPLPLPLDAWAMEGYLGRLSPLSGVTPEIAAPQEAARISIAGLTPVETPLETPRGKPESAANSSSHDVGHLRGDEDVKRAEKFASDVSEFVPEASEGTQQTHLIDSPFQIPRLKIPSARSGPMYTYEFPLPRSPGQGTMPHVSSPTSELGSPENFLHDELSEPEEDGGQEIESSTSNEFEEAKARKRFLATEAAIRVEALARKKAEAEAQAVRAQAEERKKAKAARAEPEPPKVFFGAEAEAEADRIEAQMRKKAEVQAAAARAESWFRKEAEARPKAAVDAEVPGEEPDEGSSREDAGTYQLDRLLQLAAEIKQDMQRLEDKAKSNIRTGEAV